jgi:hypothetical protein
MVSRNEFAGQIVRRLRSVALGAVSMLNNIAFRKYRVDFASLLIDDPMKAYEVLLEYTKGDHHRARLLLRTVLVAFIPPQELLRALDALEKGDAGPLRRALEKYMNSKK